MTNKECRYLIQRIKENKYLTRDETNYIIEALEQQPCEDCISRQAAIDKAVPLNLFGREVMMVSVSELENLSSAQPEIIHCKECKYGVQDEDKRWYCRGLGCQIGNEDGSGFCADAERKTDDRSD